MLAQVLIAEADSFVARSKDLKAINHKTLPARRCPPRCLRYKGTCQKGDLPGGNNRAEESRRFGEPRNSH